MLGSLLDSDSYSEFANTQTIRNTSAPPARALESNAPIYLKRRDRPSTTTSISKNLSNQYRQPDKMFAERFSLIIFHLVCVFIQPFNVHISKVGTKVRDITIASGSISMQNK